MPSVTTSAGLGAGALDQRVDGDGRAVNELVDGAGGEPALVQAVDDALDQIVRRRQAFGVDEAPGFVVETDQVGKGAADIDRDGNHVSTPRRLRLIVAMTVAAGRWPSNGICGYIVIVLWL